MDATHAAIPALLALSAVHQRLVRDGIRMHTGLVVETAEAREVHHFALLIGFGAAAVNPYLALDSLRALADAGELPVDHEKAQENFIHAIDEGLLKVMSKMGISTLQSYRGAQIFEAVGLEHALVERHFTGTPSRVEGVGLPELGREVRERHARGFGAGVGVRAGAARRGRPVPVAPPRRDAQVEPGDHREAAGGDARRTTRPLFAEYSRLADDESRRALQPARAAGGRREGRDAGAARGGGAGRGDREALRHRAPCPSAPSAPRPTRRWPSR